MAKKRTRVKVSSTGSRKDAARDFANKKRVQRRKALQRRAVIVGAIAISVSVGVQLWQWQRSGVLEQVASMPYTMWHRGLAGAGLRVDQVYVSGRHYTGKEALETALAAPQGSSILALDLQAMRKAAEAIPEVRRARISREWPSKLHVVIEERKPAVIWQHAGKQVLMDNEGMALDATKYSGADTLMVAVGADAPAHVPELLKVLATEPVLARDVKAAVRVGERRWNLLMKGDVTVMLPEEGTQRAWKRFAHLVKNEALLTHALSTVDMRLLDRVFITPIDQPQSPVIFSSAQST